MNGKSTYKEALPMGHYQIKKMESEAEISGKAYVHYKSWHETYAGLIDEGYLSRFTLEKCTEIAHRTSDQILVAKDGDTVIGFVAYGACRDNTLPQHGEVYAIYVLEAYYGKQIGYALMNAAMEQLADYPKIAVWVLKGNDRAIGFYERYGFCFDGAETEVTLGTPNIERRMIYVRTK
jgi:ribosomal protein S18 acetylase RimI-like enzyme